MIQIPLETLPPKKPDAIWLAVLLTLTGGCMWFCSMAAAVILTGGMVALTINPNLFTPQTSLILRLDPAVKVTPDRQAMLDIIKTLEDRSQHLGYAKISFSLTGPQQDRILVKLPKEMDYESLIAQITQVGLVELVDFGTDHQPDGTLIRTDLRHSSLPDGEGPARHTIISNLAIASAAVSKAHDGKNFTLGFELNPEGTQLLKEYTTDNRGKYLAIVLDKKVVTTPMVNTIIPDGRVVVDWIKEEVANNLVLFMATKPLPAALIIEKVVP
jgi:preprotein translocase subunit SecD